MTLRVATVLSAREWEARFVSAARESAAVRLVLRAYVPDDVSRRAAEIDVVVAGAETPWVTPTRIAAWRRQGVKVVGVRARSDRPAEERFRTGGVDLVVDEDLDPDHFVREIRLLQADGRVPHEQRHPLVVVTGTHGAPGRTEVAVALAWASAGRRPSVLLDGDLDAPAVAVRLALPPRPDFADCVDAALDGAPLGPKIQRIGRLGVVTGAMRDASVRPDSLVDIAEAVAADETVIIDAGPWSRASECIGRGDRMVFVVEATPIGVVRAAAIVDGWEGSAPALVLNRVDRRAPSDPIRAVRRWCGLEPAAVVFDRRGIRSRARSGAAPHRSLVKAVCGLAGGADG